MPAPDPTRDNAGLPESDGGSDAGHEHAAGSRPPATAEVDGERELRDVRAIECGERLERS